FAAGMERLFIACEELGISLADEKKVDVFIVSLGEQARKWALKTLPIFRENGISATMDYLDRSMRAQMKDANRENATYALIVGDNELEEGKFTLRNMKESEESVLDLASIIEKIN
ncbi:MAG TPA: histidine--tRNA ligase, partial [Balneola sp.]|nr:histidine--tRNA ligase [Balneola sp.]